QPTPRFSTLSLHDALPIYARLRPEPEAGPDAMEDGRGLVEGRREPERDLRRDDVAREGDRVLELEAAHGLAVRVLDPGRAVVERSEEHTSELQSLRHLVCR